MVRELFRFHFLQEIHGAQIYFFIIKFSRLSNCCINGRTLFTQLARLFVQTLFWQVIQDSRANLPRFREQNSFKMRNQRWKGICRIVVIIKFLFVQKVHFRKSIESRQKRLPNYCVNSTKVTGALSSSPLNLGIVFY